MTIVYVLNITLISGYIFAMCYTYGRAVHVLTHGVSQKMLHHTWYHRIALALFIAIACPLLFVVLDNVIVDLFRENVFKTKFRFTFARPESDELLWQECDKTDMIDIWPEIARDMARNYRRIE